MADDPLDNHTSRLQLGLDLNEYETRAYLSILEGGVVVAREVSDRAAIPYAKVYQTLNTLEQKQLIIADEGRPKKFQARDPQEAVNDRLENIEREWKQSHDRRKQQLQSIMPDLQAIFENSGVQFEREQGVWNIIGLSNILSRVNKLMALSSSSVLVISGDSKFLDNYLSKILTGKPIQTKVLVLVNNPDFIHPQVDRITVWRSLGETTQIFFDNYAQITITCSERGKFTSGEYNAVLTQIEGIVQSARTTFDSLMEEKSS